MKKLLLTLTKKSKTYYTMLLLLFSFAISTGLLNAQTSGLTQCICMNNETFPGNGQFEASIIVFSEMGESWTLVDSDGFYDRNFSNPAVARYYDVGTPLVDEGNGRYTLEGLHYSDSEWSVVATNGQDLVTITASYTCSYPDKIIRGDKDVCLGEEQDYWVNVPLSDIAGNLNWTLSSGGVLTGAGTEVHVAWDNTVGVHQLSVTGSTLEGCDIDETATIYIRDNTSISLACNNLVKISMNSQCEVTLTPNQFLEDMKFTEDAYEISLRHVEFDTIIPNGIIDGRYIGIPIEVTVIHQCSGNSCWSEVILYDENVPDLVCAGPDTLACDESVLANLSSLPIPLGVTAEPDGAGGYILHGFDGCGDAFLTYTDEVLSANLCTGPLSSQLRRHWLVTDESGNTSTCSNIINIERATLDDIVFPGHWDDVLGPNPSLEACSTFPTLPNGHPDPSYTGEPEGVFCLNVIVSYTDIKIPICGENSYKIRRKWKVSDVCNGTFEEYNQNITVMDTKPPVCTAPPEYSVNTTENSCASAIDVLPPTIINECSEWDYYVSYKLKDEVGVVATTDNVVGNSQSGFTILNIPPGQDTVWIMYNVFDECGNFSACFTEVGIIDGEQPVPVCDLHSFVALNDDGEACVGWQTFDDGSWDNCGIERYEVERMDGAPCGSDCPDGLIKFCCEDVGEVIMVQLTVWDFAGNSNSCMVEAEVQDNIAPKITFCPKDRTIDCSQLPLSYSQYGTIEAEDNCSLTITVEVIENLNECNVGTIRRVFTAADDQGNEAKCTQILTITSLTPFGESNIDFPNDYTILDGCSDTDTSPDGLSYPYDRPRWSNEDCAQVAAVYEDRVFQFAEDACYKILRTWTVTDWCKYVPNPYNPPNPPGRWISEQVIKVMNNTAPTITQGCNNVTIEGSPNANCRVNIDIVAEANDDCSSDETLVWSYKVDYYNNGVTDRSGTTNNASGLYPSGTHKVYWTVADDCGNVTECNQLVTVHDDKNPTPYCLGGVVTVMPEEGVIEIWASDFDKGSYDSCPEDGNVVVAFSTNPNDNVFSVSCEDMTGASDTFDIKMYVIDDEGNYDYCESKLIVQDNHDVCPDVDPGEGEGEGEGEGSSLTLGGHVFTADNQMITGTAVEMTSSNNSEETTIDMTVDGSYAFHDINPNSIILLEPTMSGDYMEGVSTLDLILIQRHILRLKMLDSPYKVIAADIDNSGRITALDLIHLRKLILGKYDELPLNSSWRFVDAQEIFENEEVPFPFVEEVSYPSLDETTMDADFIAVKIGDVNNSLNLVGGSSDVRDAKEYTFNYSSETIDDIATMSVYSTTEDNIEGFQTTLNFDANKYSFKAIKPGKLLLTSQNVNSDLAQRGIITISYSESVAISDVSEALFSIEFETKYDAIEGMVFNSDKTVSEVYINNTGSIETKNLSLVAKANVSIANGFEIFQNVPNPFEDMTTIKFNIDEADYVALKVFDLNGKVIYQKSDNYNAGINEIQIDAKDIETSGILYYQLETSTGTLGSKMILIK